METEIPVLVDGKERWITGLTKRTTCDDVIYAILHYENVANMSSFTRTVMNYAIFERRQHTERRIKGRTNVWRILRGSDRDDVKFIFRELESPSEPGEAYRSKKYVKYYHRNSIRRRESKGFSSSSSDDSETDTDMDYRETCKSRSKLDFQGPNRPVGWTQRGKEYPIRSYIENQQNTKRKATDDMAVVHNADIHSSTELKHDEELSKIIMSLVGQERTLQEQKARMAELDAQIETYETKLHMARLKENGANYVQDTYLKGQYKCNNEDMLKRVNSDILSNVKSSEIGEYMEICENIMKVEEKLKEAETSVHDLTLQLFEESRDSSYFQSNVSTPKNLPNGKEITKLKQELKLCVDTSTYQENDMQLNNQSMQLIDDELSNKYDAIHELSTELGIIPQYFNVPEKHLGSLSYGEPNQAEYVPHTESVSTFSVRDSSQYYSTLSGTDMCFSFLNKSDDSDTGVSSLHSASEDSNQILETLV